MTNLLCSHRILYFKIIYICLPVCHTYKLWHMSTTGNSMKNVQKEIVLLLIIPNAKWSSCMIALYFWWSHIFPYKISDRVGFILLSWENIKLFPSHETEIIYIRRGHILKGKRHYGLVNLPSRNWAVLLTPEIGLKYDFRSSMNWRHYVPVT